MPRSEVNPTTPAGTGVGAGAQLFAQGVQLLGQVGVAVAIRNALTGACNRVDTPRHVANGGVLISLTMEVSQIVAEPDFPPPPIVKGAHIVGYPENPYDEIRRQMSAGHLYSGHHGNVNLEIYYLWVTPRMLVERDYAHWPILAKQVIDLSRPSLLMRLLGPACRRLDELSAQWARDRAERKARAEAEQRARARSRPRSHVPPGGGGDIHTYNQ